MGLNSNGASSQEVPHYSTKEDKNEENSTPLPQPHSSQLRELIRCENTVKERGFETPTSPDHKIPALLECPPAPRKPKSKKRMRPPMILLDVLGEIDAMFPWVVTAGHGNPINGNIKRVKVEDNSITG